MGRQQVSGGTEGREMKTITIVLLACVLIACAPLPTYEQLETEAMLTGDWSAVEKRERAMIRHGSLKPIQCPSEFVAVCINEIGKLRCSCVSSVVAREDLRSD